jgi:hypothetical protein
MPALCPHASTSRPISNARSAIWGTGFHHALDWIDLPIAGPDGEPRHTSGISTTHSGLYFVGQHFLHSG